MVVNIAAYYEPIMIFSTTVFGIFLYKINIFNMKSARIFNKTFAKLPESQKALKDNESRSISFSDNEASVDREELTRVREDPRIELRLFKDLGDIFSQEIPFLLFAFFFVFAGLLVVSFLYLEVKYVVCFCIGYADFYISNVLTRRLFVKLNYHLELNNDSIQSKRNNWNTFNFFISATFFGLNFTLAIFGIYLVSLFHRFFVTRDQLKEDNIEDIHRTLKFSVDFISYAICCFYYIIGKNLIFFLSNVWESYATMMTSLKLSTGLVKYPARLVYYSLAYSYNLIMRSLKHNIIVTEVIVFSTLFLAKYKGVNKDFYLIFTAVLLWYLLLFSFVTITCYSFSKLGDYIKTTIVMKIGFIYYFVTVFTFLFYHFFIKTRVNIVDEQNIKITANFTYLYLFIAIVLALIFSFNYFYTGKFPFKKERKFKAQSTKVFAYNLVVFSKISVTILALYFFYVFFGFLGIGLIVFFLTLEDSFYKINKIAFIFDTYVNLILLYCRTCHVNFLDLNNIYNLIDKNYFYHFVILMFCIPLYRMDHIRYISEPQTISYRPRTDSGFIFIGVVCLSFLLCRFFLMLYSSMVLENYRQREKKGCNELFTERRANGYVMKYRFVLCASVVFFIFVFLFVRAVNHHLLLCFIVGNTIQIYQLVFMNKFRIKKLSGAARNIEPAKLESIYQEIGNSYIFMKSLCETSFGEILLELNKMLLIIYFFLSFFKPQS